MTDSRFEGRYVVLKQADIEEYLGRPEMVELVRIVRAVESCREKDGKEPLQGIFIRDTWPEYENAANTLKERIARER